MKKLIGKINKTFLSGILLIGLGGCSQESVHKLRDGTFTGVANGYNGKVKVEAVFEDQKIKSVKILEEEESDVIADSALSEIPKYVIENQSLNVDISTGATVTSKAVIKAIGTAIETAGGDEVEWQNDCTGKHVDKEVTMNTTVAVIGGGYSGILTALRLRQYDIKTTLIEKNSELGGSLPFMENASQITAGSTEFEQEDELDYENMIQELCGENGNQEFAKLLWDHVGETTDWQIEDLGIVYKENEEQSDGITSVIHQFDTSSGSMNTLLTKEIGVSGTEIIKNTAVIGFVKENGKVVAVRAKSSNGSVIQVNADYFVIASGSYGNYATFDENVIPFEGNKGNTGDLLTIASDENTSFSTYSSSTHYYMYTGLQVDETHAVDTYDAIQKCLSGGAVILNRSGSRFVAEDSDWNTLSNAIATQSQAYVVLNGSSYRTFKNSLLSIMSEEEKDVMLDESNDMEDRYAYANLEEACEALELDYDSFEAAITSYNADVENGVDNRYGRDEDTLEHSINEEDTIYVIPLSMYTYAGESGLEINQNLQVLSNEQIPVENVYAVGSVCGNLFGDYIKNSALVSWSSTSAYLAAEKIATVLGVASEMENMELENSSSAQ